MPELIGPLYSHGCSGPGLGSNLLTECSVSNDTCLGSKVELEFSEIKYRLRVKWFTETCYLGLVRQAVPMTYM
jgi:hypothetical protein